MKTIKLIFQNDGDIAIYEDDKRVYYHTYWMDDSLEENQREAFEFVKKTYGVSAPSETFFDTSKGVVHIYETN